jgi:hypothetical protein
MSGVTTHLTSKITHGLNYFEPPSQLFRYSKGKIASLHFMKASGVLEVQLHPFLTSAIYPGDQSHSCPGDCMASKEQPVPTG